MTGAQNGNFECRRTIFFAVENGEQETSDPNCGHCLFPRFVLLHFCFRIFFPPISYHLSLPSHFLRNIKSSMHVDSTELSSVKTFLSNPVFHPEISVFTSPRKRKEDGSKSRHFMWYRGIEPYVRTYAAIMPFLSYQAMGRYSADF